MAEQRLSRLFHLLGLLALLLAPLLVVPSASAQGSVITIKDAFLDANSPPCPGGTQPLSFVVDVSPPSPSSISFQYATADGPTAGGATAPTDYQPSSQTVVLGASSTGTTITIQVSCNAVLEPDEVFFVNLSAPSAGTTIGRAQAVGTIQGVPPMSISGTSVTEGNTGTTAMQFTVSIPRTFGANLTGTVTTSDGPAAPPTIEAATAGVDYTALAATPVTITAGQTSTTVTVNVTGDTLYERNERLQATLAPGAGAFVATAVADGLIMNDDAPPQVSISCVPNPVAEGPIPAPVPNVAGPPVPVNCTAALNVLSGVNAQVTVATADGTARAGATLDYVALPATLLTIPAGSLSIPVLAINVNDDVIFEGNETFAVNLSNPVDATLATGTSSATVTITDNDPPPSVSIGDATVLEGDSGQRVLAFPINLSAIAGVPIGVTYNTSDGTAQANTTAGAVPAGGDYLAVTGGTATFAPGITSQNISILIIGDTLDEFDETFSVTLSAPTPTGVTIGNATGTGTIQDDDPPPSVSISDATVLEGDTGTKVMTFTVTLSKISGKPISVDYATAPGTALAGTDYTTTNGTLTFPAGTTTRTLTVNVIGDTISEDAETFTVNLSNPDPTYPPADRVSISDGQGQGTINDNDSGPAITINDQTITEGAFGTNTTVNLTVSLAAPSGKAITVSVATADGTARSNTTPDAIPATGDYTTLPATTLTFPAGTTTQTVAVEVRGDNLDEDNETFNVVLSNATGGATIGDDQGVVTITNDDVPPTISIGDASVPEGNNGSQISAVFVVTLSAPSGREVRVNYQTVDGTAVAPGDYLSDSRVIVIPPGAVTQSASIFVNGDNTDEPNETFTVRLTTPVNATIARSQGIGTIIDDDGPTINIGDASVSEGNSGTTNMVFNVRLMGAATFPVTVNYTTANDTALAGSDYISATGSVTFANASEMTKTVTIQVRGDTLVEDDETFFVTLSSPVGAAIGDGQAVGTIINDDAVPTMSLSCPPTTTEGNSGLTTVQCTVTLSTSSAVTVTVSYSTQNGTAIAPLDYVTSNGLLSFAPGETSKNITLQIVGDTLVEPDETLLVRLSGSTGATIVGNEATITIQNDDSPASFKIYMPLIRRR